MPKTLVERLRVLQEIAPGVTAIADADLFKDAADEMEGHDRTVREFLGWLSGELPELHHVEVPRLGAAWDKYKALGRDGASVKSDGGL